VFHLKAKDATPAALTVVFSCMSLAAWAADAPQPEIPTCDKKIGTLAVTEPQNQWWLQYNLESPEALIKVYVSKSKCFTLLDRNKGLAAAEQERALAGSGEMRGGSNIGKGQMKAADYVLVPDVAMKNNDSGGKRIGAMLGGLLPGVAGVVAGGVSMKSKTADVVLTLTDVRSTEQVALEQGHYKKTDLGWGGGGGGFFGAFAAAGASSYANTEIGQVVAIAYLDAYTKLVTDVKSMNHDAKTDNVQQSVTMARPGKLYKEASNKSEVIRDLDPGMTLYPTGEKDKIWWKVQDELGNEGWVPSPLFQLAK
jgi:Curli production assembly/transport component CsgG